MNTPWRHTLLGLGIWLALCAIAGGLLGAVWPMLALGLATALAWCLWRTDRLLRQVSGRRRISACEGRHVFAEIGRHLFVRQRERHRRKRRLRTLLRAFRQAVAALPDGVLIVGADHLDIEWFNSAAADLLGLQHPRDAGARLPRLPGLSRVAEWVAAGAAEPLFDLPAPLDPARRLSLRLIDYTPQQKLLVVRDISKLMQLEQMRRDFVGNVSHELRTPLTVIHGYLELFDPEEAPQWAPQLAEMRRQSQRMTQLVEDLLTLSRLEARESLPEEPVSMQGLLASLLREANTLSDGHHAIRVEDEGSLDLLGSERDLHSAFSNLVANAVRYTPEGGEIIIRFERNGRGACLSVVDTGPGIPAEHLPRLTERFYRISTSRSRLSGGTGLGLAIVKHVLQLHHAQLQIRSEPGRGSCFCAVFKPAQVIARERGGGA
jgi:two-component system, OmpR family, phosphate regulon sensor histidine kinase PhoR